jgi:hypothetical protein
MNDRTLISLFSTSILIGTTTVTLAEPAPNAVGEGAMPAIQGGLELAVALKFADSYGDIGGGMEARHRIGSAPELEVQVGRRITPHLALGFYISGQAFTQSSVGRKPDVYTGAAGIEADLHINPRYAIDPWISIGAGARALLVEEGDGHSIAVGAELARMQLGIDFRVSEDLAFGPVFGASASLYGAKKSPMADFEELTDKGISWTFSAGFAGRFNAFGTRR